MSSDGDIGVRAFVAANPSAKPELLQALANDPALPVREAVAGNTATPALAQLAQDKNWEVRVEVALNSATPVELLNTLSADKVTKVRWAVAENNKAPSINHNQIGNRS